MPRAREPADTSRGVVAALLGGRRHEMEVDAHASTANALLNLGQGAQAIPIAAAEVDPEPLPTAEASPAPALPWAYPSVEEGVEDRRSHTISSLPRKEWTPDEDERIRRGVESYGCRWRSIAAHLPGRSDDAVRNRWSRLQVRAEGGEAGSGRSSDGVSPPCAEGATGAASSGAGGAGSGAPRARSRESARRPRERGKSERSSWTRAEDDIIIAGVAELGHKWYEIARRLPGRTDHAIRNRWSRLQTITGALEGGPSALVGATPARAMPVAEAVQADEGLTPQTAPTRVSPPPVPPLDVAEGERSTSTGLARSAGSAGAAPVAASLPATPDGHLLLGLAAPPPAEVEVVHALMSGADDADDAAADGAEKSPETVTVVAEAVAEAVPEAPMPGAATVDDNGVNELLRSRKRPLS